MTRPREDAPELIDLLAALGADAIEAPMIRFAPPDDSARSTTRVARIDAFAWIVFTSANAVDQFMCAAVRRQPATCGR